MTYTAIIQANRARTLRTAAPPQLRLLPKHDDTPPEVGDLDVIAWAKSRAARGHRLAAAPAPEPCKPRQHFKRNPELRYLLNRGGWWHFQRITKGEVVRFALNTRDLSEAQRLRDKFLNPTSGKETSHAD
jgi:hypothetical protein